MHYEMRPTFQFNRQLILQIKYISILNTHQTLFPSILEKSSTPSELIQSISSGVSRDGRQ